MVTVAKPKTLKKPWKIVAQSGHALEGVYDWEEAKEVTAAAVQKLTGLVPLEGHTLSSLLLP